MTPIQDHPLRYKLTNELHARPFPTICAPGQVVFLAIKRSDNAASRDHSLDLLHLLDLLERHGTAHPPPDATHFSGQIGRWQLKWESHSEFVTYTAYMAGRTERAFDRAAFDAFPDDWLTNAPGVLMTSIQINLDQMPDEAQAQAYLQDWFVTESLACSTVLDNSALIAGDFRIDAAGHVRFALLAAPDTGPQRIGRIVQRLCEIETYKTMSMLGFSRARKLVPEMNRIENTLGTLTDQMVNASANPEETLSALLPLSAEVEQLMSMSNYRFAATSAYSAIVNQRVGVLREERFMGRQTFAEFMMRRFDPAMRTVESSRKRLAALSRRALRLAELLRTRVDVERSAQNQKLLASMDHRADLQLRLQQTVEGLSVVAISYYAVNLAAYAIYPLTNPLGISKGLATAILTPPVIAVVWWMIRQIRRGMGH